jgi:hypothetical protein
MAEGEFVEEGAAVRVIGFSVGQLKVRASEDTPKQSGGIQ